MRTAPHQPAPSSPDPIFGAVACPRPATALAPEGAASVMPGAFTSRDRSRRPCPRRLRFARLQPRLAIARSRPATLVTRRFRRLRE